MTATKPTSSPLITVVMPARNAAAYVREAIESVLGQDFSDAEVVVVDDGSTDRTREIVLGVADGRVRVIDGPRTGIAGALNAGLAAARGRLWARCDADDRFAPGRLTWQLERLAARPEFGAVCGRFSTMTSDGRHLSDLRCCGPEAKEITGELRDGLTRTSLCTFLARTDDIRAVGGFRDYFATAEDLDLQLRLSEVIRVWYEPIACYHYRLHKHSITHTQVSRQREFFEGIAKQMQRQRLGSDGIDDLARGCPPTIPSAAGSVPSSVASDVQMYLMSRAWREQQAGHRLRAIGTGFRACMALPYSPSAWQTLARLTSVSLRNAFVAGATAPTQEPSQTGKD